MIFTLVITAIRCKKAASAACFGKCAGKGEKADTRQRTPKLKFTYQESKDYETIETDIAALEKKIQQCDLDMAANSTDFIKLNQLQQEKEQLEQQLLEKMERWEYLMEKAEQIARQK